MDYSSKYSIALVKASRYAVLVLVCALGSQAALAELALTATLDRTSQAPLGRALVNVLVSNNGTSIETGVDVIMQTPVGLAGIDESLVDGPLDGDASCETDSGNNGSCTENELLVWAIGSILPGQVIPLSFPVTISSSQPAGAAFEFEFVLNQNASPVANASTTLTVADGATPNISLIADRSPAASGEQIRYTINFGNSSDVSVTNTSLSLELPSAVSFDTATGNGVAAGNLVTWSLGSLPSGGVDQQEVVVTVNTASDGTPLLASATISGVASSLPTEQQVSQATYVGSGSSLDIALSLAQESVAPGEQTLLNVLIANPTSSAVTGGELTIRAPVGFFDIEESLVEGPLSGAASCAQDGGNNGACRENESLIFTLGTIAPGRTIPISFPVRRGNNTAPGSITSLNLFLSDDGPLFEQAAIALAIEAEPAISLVVSTGNAVALAEDEVRYTVNYGNTDEASVTGSLLTLALPLGVVPTSISDAGTFAQGTVSWPIGSIPAGGVGARTVIATLPTSVANGNLLQAEATLTGVRASLPTTQRTTHNLSIGPGSPLELSLVLDPATATPGALLQLELLVTNPSADAVFGGNVRLRLPTSVADVDEPLVEGPLDADASCANEGGNSGSCITNEIFVWNLGNVAPGQASRLSLPFNVFNNTLPGFQNSWQVVVGDDAGQFEAVRLNVPVAAISGLNLALTNNADPVSPGTRLSYELAYGNPLESSVTASSLTFELPLGVVFVSASGTGTLVGNQVVWSLGSLASEAIGRQSVLVEIPDDADAGTQLFASAELQGTFQNLPISERATDSDFVGMGSALTLEFSATPDPVLANAPLSVDIRVTNPGDSTIFGAMVRLRTPAGISDVNESMVQGPLDADASCANEGGNSGSCITNEIFVWNLGNVAPSQVIDLSFPATTFSNLNNGDQISWAAILQDDTGAVERASQTLQVGVIPPAGPLVSSILPGSRSVQVGQIASAFATIINTSSSPAIGCSIAPITAVPAEFSFQATDPLTNAPVGIADAPVDIPGGGAQSFVFFFAPTAAIPPTDVALAFDCSNSDPANVSAVNTLLLSAETNSVPDIIGLTTTVTLDASTEETILFAVGSANVGITGQITVSVGDNGVGLPAALNICQTDPLLGSCISAIGPAVTLEYDAETTASFAVFVGANEDIAFSPEINRVFIVFTDSAGVVRGATSTAVRTVDLNP